MKQEILVIRLGSLGDIVLTSATVANLKIGNPGCRIVYFCKEKFRSIVELIDGVDEIVVLPERTSEAGYFRLLLELDRRNFDAVIDLHGNFRSWFARKVVASSCKVVYPKRRYERIVAVKRKVIPDSWPHTIDLYNECIEQLGGRVYCRKPVVRPAKQNPGETGEAFRERNGCIVVVAPGAAHPNKRWPLERFAEVATSLHKSNDAGIMWAVKGTDHGERSPADDIKEGSFLELVDCPVERLAGVIAEADLTIANDSGVAHLSSAVGTPVVAVFGPTHPALGFAPRGQFDRVIEVDEFCRPCSLHGKRECYRDRRYCFDRISADMVWGAAKGILDSDINSSRAAFVDRDGTIIVDKDFLANPDEIEFEQGSVKALRIIKSLGYKIVIVSNQSGVARGLFDAETVERVNARLLEMLAIENVEVDGIYYCPHYDRGTVSRYTVQCNCRKPAPGMLEEAACRLGVDLRESVVIGDKLDDVHLGKVSGAASILVRTGYGGKVEPTLAGDRFYKDVRVVDNLRAAADCIETVAGHG